MSKEQAPIVIASGNRNKIAELRTVAEEFGIELAAPGDLRELRGLGPAPDVDETGTDYYSNALLKAQAFQRWAGCAALGDDSGLEVTALGNAPGIYSARYAGEGATDEARIEKILRELKATGSSDRTARFRCELVLVTGSATYHAEGVLEGTVLDAPRGTKGFGYDPIIYLPSLGSTLAEVDFDVTCRSGFRAIAARNLFAKLRAGGVF